MCFLRVLCVSAVKGPSSDFLFVTKEELRQGGKLAIGTVHGAQRVLHQVGRRRGAAVAAAGNAPAEIAAEDLSGRLAGAGPRDAVLAVAETSAACQGRV